MKKITILLEQIFCLAIAIMLLPFSLAYCEIIPTSSEQVYRVISSNDELNKYPGIKNFIKIIRDYDNQQRIETQKESIEVGIGQMTIGGKYLQKFSGNSFVSDLNAMIKTFPGVVAKGDFDANLYVRGGNSYEVTTLIDDQVTYAPYFWSGKVNMVNPKLIESMTFYSGGFPARYGRMMSGVLDIKQITGDTLKNHFELDQNLTEFNFLMHGPIKADESSWLFSARKTYYDILMSYFSPGTTVLPGFDSYYAKLYFKLSPNHKLYLSQQSYADIMKVADNLVLMEPDADARNTYSRLQYMAKLESNWTESLNSRVNAGWENYSLYHYYKSFDRYRESLQTRTPIFGSAEVEIQTAQNKGAAGLYVSREKVSYSEDIFSPPDPDYPSSVSVNSSTDYFYQYVYEGAYIQDEWTMVPNELAINAGLRYCQLSERTLSQAKALQPRAMVYVGDRDNTVFILSAGKYAIFNNPVFNGVLVDLPPEQAIHYSAGLQQVMDPSLLWKAEVFYKDYYSLVRDVRNPATGVVTGYDNQKSGIATGFEFMLQKRETDNWSGSFCYSIASVKYKDPDHDWYFADHDQEHTLNISGLYKFNPEWKMTTNLYVSSGRPYTDITGVAYEPSRNIWIPQKTAANVVRQPYVCKLDLCFEYLKPIWPLDKFQGSVYFGFSNILNIQNVYKYYWNQDYTVKHTISMLPIMPIFGIKAIF